MDTNGPLTLRIEGPSEVTKTGVPVPVHAVIENSGDKPVKGQIRLAVIDGWKVVPAESVAFMVESKGTKRMEFSVIAGERTYAAHYPIHAFVEADGSADAPKAHAVLVVEAKVPNPARAVAPVEWKPVIVPAGGVVGLCGLPVRRVIVHVFGEKPMVMPVGWSGTEPGTYCTAQPGQSVTRGTAREAIGMHPPFFNGRVGTVLAEYPVRLPAKGPIRIRFANAMRDLPPAGEPPTDGVLFRVRVLSLDAPAGQEGEVVYERFTDTRVWLDGEADLSRFAGRDIRVQLESHPGPKNNVTCDQSYWAEATVIAGAVPEPTVFPPAAEMPSRVLGAIPFGSGSCEVRVWPGKRGLLDSAVGFVAGERRLVFHGFKVRVLGDVLNEVSSAITLVSATEEPMEGGYRVRHHFAGWTGGFDVVGELRVVDGVLRARFGMENEPAVQPWQVTHIEDVAAGGWNEQAARVYAGQGNVVINPQAFVLGFDGHRLSTSFVGFDFSGGLSLVQACDNPPDRLEVDPKSRTYTLHVPHAQTMTFIPTTNVWAAVRRWGEVNGLHPAGGVRKLAGRFVFDLWGGRYADLAAALRRSFRYGLTDALVVGHNWQRWGYDYRLPDIYPPNPSYGTLTEYRDLVETCRKEGVLFAPHDNYIDYYPDAEDFSYARIAFNADGTPLKGWFNPGPKAQAYRFRTEQVWPALKRNVRLIKAGFSPTAYFIDVWSSAGPTDEWSWDGKLQSLVDVRRTWGEAFAWIRDQLGDNAPQISESGHDQLIGWLDGSQVNHLRVEPNPGEKTGWLVWPIPCEDAERIPWFDAAHHDRFAQHGAGYPGRYEGGLDPKEHGIYSDDYVCTEMLTGHPAMVSHPFGRDVVRMYWLTHDVARALAMKRIESVEFVDGDIHRQHVCWEGKGQVWVNRGKTDWTIDGRVLPPYGFYAAVPSAEGAIQAAIERQGGKRVEWSTSSDATYLSARPSTLVPQGTSTAPTSQTLRDEMAAAGPATTDGACRIQRGKGLVQVTPLPDGGRFTLRLRQEALVSWLPEPFRIEAVNETGGAIRSVPVIREGGNLVLNCEPDVFAYRLTGTKN